jgi:hypothetical protein
MLQDGMQRVKCRLPFIVLAEKVLDGRFAETRSPDAVEKGAHEKFRYSTASLRELLHRQSQLTAASHGPIRVIGGVREEQISILSRLRP